MIEVFDASSSDPEIRALLDDPYTSPQTEWPNPNLARNPTYRGGAVET